MALTSDAAIDAFCEHLPQFRPQNFTHFDMPNKDELSFGLIQYKRYSDVSAFINVLGEDTPLCRKGHASSPPWASERACRRQSGRRRPPQLSTTHHQARGDTQAHRASATKWLRLAPRFHRCSHVLLDWRLAIQTVERVPVIGSHLPKLWHCWGSRHPAPATFAGHRAVRGPVLLISPFAGPLALSSSSVVRNSETSTSRPYVPLFFKIPPAPLT